MIAFLINADNFSSPAWVHEAFKTLEATEGSIVIRRAKCILIECSKISTLTLDIYTRRHYVDARRAKHYPIALLYTS